MANTLATSPGTMADSNEGSIGTVTWADVNNAKASDNSYATATGNQYACTHYLKATNFGFAIAAGNTIDGILMEIERKTSSANNVWDNSIKIVRSDGSIGTQEKASATAWPDTDTYKSYGGATDKWGVTWANTDINDADFGVVVSVIFFANSVIGYVDHIRITVYYSVAAGGLSIPVVMNQYRQRVT